MTELAFHFNARDRFAYTCRLLRKAVTTGAHLTVIGPREILEQLDQDLWTFSATEFLPHCCLPIASDISKKTPIVLTENLQDLARQDVLINLGDQIPEGFDRFARVIEVVTQDDEDRRLARQRWRAYVQSGFSPIKYDLVARATT